jgi:small conductance mechanosensitive channel
MNADISVLGKLNQLLNWVTGHLPIIYKTLGAIVVFAIVWFVLRLVISTVFKLLGGRKFFQDNAEFVAGMRRLVFYLLLWGMGLYIIGLFQADILRHLFHALMLILMASPIRRLLVFILVYIEKNVVAKTETRVDDILFDLLNKFLGVIIYITAIVMALDLIGVNIMPFIAGAGVAGVAIGFAAKDTLSNLIAGVLLIIDRPFEVGDRIEVWRAPKGSSTWGDVVDVGLRATKIKTTDNIVVIIPNNQIMTRDIINYSTLSEKIRVRINIGVAYDTDIEKAKALIVEVARELDWVMTSPAPKVVVRNFGESSVDLQLRVWIGNARRRMDTISDITDRVKTAFDREGVEIPFPKRDITIVQKQ